MTKRGFVVDALVASVIFDLWVLYGPSRCPACRKRRTVGDRWRGYHACDWSCA
jgi:hypothetical protein